MNPLFTSISIGDLELPNRIAMAPLTRGRAGADRIPNDLERFRIGAPLNPPDFATFYTSGPKGYTDYPALELAN